MEYLLADVVVQGLEGATGSGSHRLKAFADRSTQHGEQMAKVQTQKCNAATLESAPQSEARWNEESTGSSSQSASRTAGIRSIM
jgi:hypothetical protein